MERDEAVARLPVMYQRVLAWQAQGCSREQIAADLGIDTHAVQPVIALAEAKLARLENNPCDRSRLLGNSLSQPPPLTT